MEIALSELAATLGEEMTHLDLREGLDRCRAKVLELHAALTDLGERFKLPEPEKRHLDVAREYVSVDSLSEERGVPAVGREPRAWLSETQRARAGTARIGVDSHGEEGRASSDGWSGHFLARLTHPSIPWNACPRHGLSRGHCRRS
jgi:hypothetical protein